MKQYLAPIGIFIMGQLILLVVFLFFPALGDAGTELAADTAGMASTFWGWEWVVGSVRLIVFLGFQAGIMFAVVKSFLANRG